jgi:uncharacterized membrane protein YidH (DUF202 family)
MGVRRDHGLQAERTALSWNRTAASLLLNALLAFRVGLVDKSAPIAVLACCLLVGAFALFLFSRHRRRSLCDYSYPTTAPALVMAATTLAVLSAAAIGFAAIWLR